MCKTKTFHEHTVYKPHNNKIDEENIVDKLMNCKDNCFHSFNFDCICDVKFKDIRNEKN